MQQLFIHGGKVWTGDTKLPFAEALLVRGNRFIAVGNLEEVRNALDNSEIIELSLNGNLVMPGITDAHIHLTAFAKQNLYLDLKNTRSLEELLDAIKSYARNHPEGAWIRGVGYNEMKWKNPKKLSRALLDSLDLPNPIIVDRYCGHVHVVNTLALEKAKLLENPSISDNIERDSSGMLTGRIYEEGALPIIKLVEREYETPDRVIELTTQACFQLSKIGITSVHACDAPSYGLGEDVFAFQSLEERGSLPIRVFTYHDRLPNFNFRTGFGDMWIRYAGLKVFLDGSLGGHTAALISPYTDKPNEKGLLLYSDNDLYELLYDAISRSIQVQIHMIGDAAIQQAIRVVKHLSMVVKNKLDLPIRFNHLIMCHPEQVNEIKSISLPICLDIQPIQLHTDRTMAPLRLGPERAFYSYPFKSLYETGLIVTGSTDCPMELPNPWLGIWAAVCRCELDGSPLKYLDSNERLTLDQAFHIFTVNPPKAVGMGQIMGKIKRGYLADFVVVNGDPSSMDPHNLKDTSVVYTFVDGKLSYGNIGNWPCIAKIK